MFKLLRLAIISSFFLPVFHGSPAFATLTETDRQEITTKNLLKNPGFENGFVNLTRGQTGHTVMTDGTGALGKNYLRWDATSLNGFIHWAHTVGKFEAGQSGTFSCKTRVPSGNASHTMGVDTTAGVAQDLGPFVAVNSSTETRDTTFNFVFPASGTVIYPGFYAQLDEPSIDIFQCFLGLAQGFNVFQVTPSSEWTAFTPTGTWVTNSTYSGFWRRIGQNMEVVASIATTGSVGTPGTLTMDLPTGYTIDLTRLTNATVSNPIKAANVGRGYFADSSASAISYFYSVNVNTASSVAAVGVTFSSASSHVWSLFTHAAPQTAAAGDNYGFYYSVPIVGWGGSDTLYNANSVSGAASLFHDSTCSWSRTNAAYGDFTADATCALTSRVNKNLGTIAATGSVLPALAFSNLQVGMTYRVGAIFKAIIGSGTSTNAAFRLWDGTTTIADISLQSTSTSDDFPVSLVGLYTPTARNPTITIVGASSTGTLDISAGGVGASAIEWMIFPVTSPLPTPLLVNSVVTNYAGVERTIKALVNCDASSVITSQSGGLSTIGNIASTTCALTIATGFFSAAPWQCNVTPTTAIATVPSCSCSSVTACSMTGVVTTYDAFVTIAGPR